MMKKLLIITSMFLCAYITRLKASPIDSSYANPMHRSMMLYSNLDTRIDDLDKQVQDNHVNMESVLTHLDDRFEHLENKFDSYFMWGYGSLLGIILSVVVWLLNAQHKMMHRYSRPPTPGNEPKERYIGCKIG